MPETLVLARRARLTAHSSVRASAYRLTFGCNDGSSKVSKQERGGAARAVCFEILPSG